MAKVTAARGSLQARIAAGEADPISDREREQLEELRAVFVRRFGTTPEDYQASRAARRR